MSCHKSGHGPYGAGASGLCPSRWGTAHAGQELYTLPVEHAGTAHVGQVPNTLSCYGVHMKHHKIKSVAIVEIRLDQH